MQNTFIKIKNAYMCLLLIQVIRLFISTRILDSVLLFEKFYQNRKENLRLGFDHLSVRKSKKAIKWAFTNVLHCIE